TSGVAGTQYALDGGALLPYTGPITVSAAGEHTVQYASVDAAGNLEALHTLTIRYDALPPITTASHQGPLGNGGWLLGPVSVTLSAGDATSGVAATYYTVDGGSTQTFSGSPFAVGGASTHTVQFWSVDGAGNTEAAGSDSFRIDSVAPSITPSLAGTT